MPDRKATRVRTALPGKRGGPARRKVARAISAPRPSEDRSSKGMRWATRGFRRLTRILPCSGDALAEAGCGRIFTEQLSGAVTDRPALREALAFARSGDTLIDLILGTDDVQKHGELLRELIRIAYENRAS